MLALIMRQESEVSVVEVIRVKAIRGAGTEEDPVRSAEMYFTTDGTLIGEIGPMQRTPPERFHRTSMTRVRSEEP